MSSTEKIKALLTRYDARGRYSHLSALPQASVLIPLFLKDKELHVLLTLRSLQLRSAAGEVCFPGGKREPQDRDETDTALREAEEEIGLPQHLVGVACRLVPIINKSGLMVTPVVAFIPDSFQACPNPAEVSEVFSVPLRHFLSSHAHTSYLVSDVRVHSFICSSGRDFQVWGLTALLAVLVAVLALGTMPEFEVEFDVENPLAYFEQGLTARASKL